MSGAASSERTGGSSPNRYLAYIESLDERASSMAAAVRGAPDAIERLVGYGLRCLAQDPPAYELAYVSTSAALFAGLESIEPSTGPPLPYELSARRKADLARRHPSFPIAWLAASCLDARFADEHCAIEPSFRQAWYDSLLELSEPVVDRPLAFELLGLARVPLDGRSGRTA